MARFAFVLPFLLLPALLFSAAPHRPAFSLAKRTPLTTSRVVGSPEPPPPYTTRRVFEKHAFRNPLYVTSHPAHERIFVVEQAGQIIGLDPAGKVAANVFCKIDDSDTYGMTFHPDYRKNRFVYVFANGPNSKKRKNNQIWRFTTAGDPPKCDPATKKLILEYDSNGHNGGDLGFGPDGMLYLTSGDGTTDSDGDNTGQDLRDLNSGVLRLDVERPEKGKGYSVPKDNPFLQTKDARGELWAFGLRNPWRMHFDAVTGDLYVADIGQDVMEMVYLIKKGGNYGWSLKEGTADFQPLRKKGPGPILPPLIEHPHSESRSITGGLVYRGKKFPELKDTYLYGDYSTGKVWGLRQKGGKISWKGDLAWTRLQILGFGTDVAGEIYLADYGGQVHVLEKSPPVKETVKFPRKLSESGLFTGTGEPVPALIPYSVNSPLWSDGADKERFIGLPGDERIGFTEQGPWKLPEKTVLVKTFSIDTPRGRRKIETRFLTLQRGEWAGYSYAWNDAQTDAELVEAGGKTVAFVDADKSELKWRYPSRVECMVCHTRASAWVLGVTTAQLNRRHDYGGVMNQLDALSKLGVFRVEKADHYRAFEEQLKGLDALARLTLDLPRGPESAAAKKVRETKAEQAKGRREKIYKKHGGDTTVLPRLADEYERLADPYDDKADLEARARSYLHVNCAICHVEAGGGNAAIDLHVSKPRDKMRLVGVTPIHDRYGLTDAKLVAPGSPERSVLYHRVSQRGRGQMPPLASSRTDERARKLLREWIRGLK